MASLQIRDMLKDLYESLKSKAEKDLRSLAQQAIVLLREALKAQGRSSMCRMEALKKIRAGKLTAKSKEISNMTAYDMFYAVRARRYNGRLLTVDRKLKEAGKKMKLRL